MADCLDFEHVCTLSSSINYAAFLGTPNRACAVGQIPNSMEINESKIDIYDILSSKGIGLTIPGHTTAVELCGITQTAKLFIACATITHNGVSSQMLVEVNEGTDLDDISLLPMRTFISDTTNVSIVTSMAYSSSQGILATSSETGVISLFDLNTAQTTGFNTDAAGLNQIRFDRKGQLVAVGNSGHHMTIWDIRSKSMAASRQLPQGGYLTSVCPHPVNDTIFCGTSNGSVVLWDIRTGEECLQQEHLHQGNVNILTMHPAVRGSVVSGGSDGMVMSTDFNTEINEYGLQQNGGVRFSTEILLSEPAEITSLDVHSESRSIMASTAIGGLFVKNFNSSISSSQYLVRQQQSH